MRPTQTSLNQEQINVCYLDPLDEKEPVILDIPGDDDRQSKYAGSPAFQAPEVLNYDSRDKYSGKAVDIWAMGITLYCFLYGKCPFYSNNIGELSDMIKNNLVTFPDTPILNPQVFDLMSRMLSKDANNRINILEIKEHPWVTQGGNSPLPSTEDHCTV